MAKQQTVRTLQQQWQDSPLASFNAAYVETQFENYLNDPASVTLEWRQFFDALPKQNGTAVDFSHAAIQEQFRQYARQKPVAISSGSDTEHDRKQVRVLQLINAHRFRGHQQANLDPINLKPAAELPELTLTHHQLSEADLDTEFETGSLKGVDKAPLKEILQILKATYCNCVGAEYMHITDTEEKRWIQSCLETPRGIPGFAPDIRHRILRQLIAADGLERYLHRKYIGQKRFSLEGGDGLIPMLQEVVHHCGHQGVKEVVIGMAHRGRLNVLVNIMGKTPAELFMEFEGKADNGNHNTGDVKYHMGFSSDIKTGGGPVHVALAFNPSHLEIVNPVVEGSVRARQDRRQDNTGSEVVPVIIHGDAAFAGQGVVMETFNMSQSRGFSTKGTLHIVINNQIGFTTSNQEDARSTLYCSDVAKMVSAPIFHVNGDDPEAVVFITQLAIDYRMKFNKDVVIDMVCYRRHGHSEADEPFATQPIMYQHIKQHPTPREVYTQKLAAASIITTTQADQYINEYRETLDKGLSVVKALIPAEENSYPYVFDWSDYLKQDFDSPTSTRVDPSTLSTLYKQLETLPEGFSLNRNVAKILQARHKMNNDELPVDWGFAETMAYATLLDDGFNVRLSGQDCGRGTFFHRHAVLHDQKNGKAYVPLRNLPSNANFLVINSLLSEEAVLAFEYGYATTDPTTLTIWEAQFGDFANGAQVVIDQFISAGEQKWNRLCGLVMLLPHGYEGQGPEHSSARLERYLQLCAQHNMQVCVPTTAAQIFHLLRRQMLMQGRHPLIVMSPKSLLRHPDAASPLKDLSDSYFKKVIHDKLTSDKTKVKRIVLCSGKVYYDLFNKRKADNRKDIAIIRIEQLYPFPTEELVEQLEQYPNAEKFVWCQEEPMNQGAWYSSQHHMRQTIGKKYYLEYAGRPLMAAPAVGHMTLYKKQLDDLLLDALG